MKVYLVRAYLGRDSIPGVCSTPELAKQAADTNAAQKGLALEWAAPLNGEAGNIVSVGRAAGQVWYTLHEYEVDAYLKGIS